MVTSPDAPEIHTYIEISLEHLIFQAVLHRSWSRRHYNCVGNKFLKKLYQQDSYKFLISTHNLGFRILGFYHRDQWRGAGVLAGKECWGPCHGLIASLWGFAQDYSLQIELRNQNWSGTFHPRIRFRQGNGAVHFKGGEGQAC